MNTLTELKEKSLKTNESIEIGVDLTVEVDGEEWLAHTACIANREILLYTDKGDCTYFVDTYGDRNTIELVDWEKNNE